MEDGTEAVEELEGREHLALHEHPRDDGRRGPPARADGHLEEPLLERHSGSFADHGCHVCRCTVLRRRFTQGTYVRGGGR